jgi:hypothetical protein
MVATFFPELMTWATGEGEKTYSVPVDSSIERVMIAASFDVTGGTLAVTSPDGALVRQGPGIEDTPLNCGRIVTIDKPSPGNWQVRVTPSGRYWLVSRAKTEVALIDAAFVQRGGRPGHEGLFEIQGQPIAGRPATLRVRVSSEATSATFALVALDGRPIQNVDMKAIVAEEEFIGTFDLPGEPFRVAATLDAANPRSVRVWPALFHAESIEVVPPSGTEQVRAGTVKAVTFTVRNMGPTVRLNLVATDDGGKVIGVEPPTMDLEPGSEGTATVRLTVAGDAAPETQVSVGLTASSENPAPRGNYARKVFSVTAGAARN